MITNATLPELIKALLIVNKKYDNNVEFNRYPEKIKKSNRMLFTLKVKDCSKPGHRIGFFPTKKGNPRRLSAACWHVHGDYFEALFSVNPECYVLTSRFGNTKVTKEKGNWTDQDVGSMMRPAKLSELCDCAGDARELRTAYDKIMKGKIF
jgi:hypothetical protein